MATQLVSLDTSYPSGGLAGYIDNARDLLAKSKEGVNPLEGWKPSVPKGQAFEIGTEEYRQVEALGVQELGAVGFVLVAGGLGERLGYGDIKVRCAKRDIFNNINDFFGIPVLMNNFMDEYIHTCIDWTPNRIGNWNLLLAILY